MDLIKRTVLISVIILIGALSCSKEDKEQPVGNLTRTFRMGFTTWPYAGTLGAVTDTFARVRASGDIVALHYMDGVPWTTADTELYRPEDLATVYSNEVKNGIRDRIHSTAPADALYIAIDPINGERNGIIGTFGGAAPAIGFNDAAAKNAYVNFAVYALYEVYAHYTAQGYPLPQIWFNYGSEASELILKGFNSTTGTFDSTQWDAFTGFASFVYGKLNAYAQPYAASGSPGYDDAAFIAFVNSAQLMLSVAMKSPEDAAPGNIVTGTSLTDPSEKLREDFADVLPYIDMAGVSVYPYIYFDAQWGATAPRDEVRADPSRLPQNWLSQISAIAPGKPIAITETGWIARDYDVNLNGAYIIASTDERQAQYMNLMLAAAESLAADFVIMFTIADYHPLWNTWDTQTKIFGATWLSTGLYSISPETGAGPFTLEPRPALSVWDRWLSYELR
jgi:hypothetical protein